MGSSRPIFVQCRHGARGLRRGASLLRAPTAVALAAVAVACGAAFLGGVARVSGFTAASNVPGVRKESLLAHCGRKWGCTSAVATRATGSSSDSASVAPLRPRVPIPNSTEAMCRMAADAVMTAYRDGFTRQTIRLRTDAVNVAEANDLGGGTVKLLKAALPLVRSFTTKLWGGNDLKELKTSIIDGEVATLVYREAENALQDAAVFFLPGRDLVVQDNVLSFFESMGDRLVVLSNPEEAPANWKVENQGRDFYLASDADAGADVARMFKEQTYYFYKSTVNNWQFTWHRVYPHPWEIYLESLDYELVKVGEFADRPSFDQIFEAMDKYEADNQIKVPEKVGKILKDNQERGAEPAVA